MGLSSYKITSSEIAQKGVVAAPDRLTGTAAQNKAVFDRLIREAVAGLFNGLIDELTGEEGAGDIGLTEIDGVTGSDVQTVLGSVKTILDTKSASADTAAALALKSDKSVTDLHVKSVSFNAQTGVFTFTREDGTYTAIDTALEKVATNWQYDAATQSLVLTLVDGTTQTVPLSAFITETEFTASDSITFSVSNHVVSASVKSGSITDSMLSSALVAQLQGYVSDAASSATAAAQSATAAEGYKNTASQMAADAAGSASNAAGSASAAGRSADNAAGSADDAADSATAAATSATTANQKAMDAEDSAEDSEAWAVGQRGGTDVPSSDETYHNNARYWAGQAEQIVGGDYALRSQIADAETTGTASKAYAIGELFTYNGVFYKATAAIAQGGTITPGTNCAVVVIADEMVSHMDPIGRLLIGSTQPAALTEQNTWIKGRVVESNAPDTLTIGEVLTALGVDWSAYASDNTILLTVGSMGQGQTDLSGSAYNIKLALFTHIWNITYSDGVYGGGVADTVYIDIRTQGGTILYSETGCANLLSVLNQVGIIVDEVHRKLGNSTMKVHFSEMDAKADATALTTHTGNSDIHVTAAQKTAWSGKQDALTFDSAPTSGSTNPVTSGGVYTAIQNAGKEPYVYSFAANDWTAGTDDATITIAAATHGFTGSGVLAQFWHQVSGAYLFNTWACIESWAEIDASTHVVTLHGPTAGYAGKVILYG